MDDKLTQARMDEHLSNTKWDIRAALQRFEETGVKIDRKFRRDFIKQTTDCVIDTCEQYCSDNKERKIRKDKCLDKVIDVEKKNSKHRKSMKDDENGNRRASDCNHSPTGRRKYEQEQTPENQKRRKIEEEIILKNALNISKNGIEDVQPKQTQSTFFFYCTHCLDANELGESIGGAIEDVYKHWQSSHLNQIPLKPFQFNVSEIAVCRFGDAIGTYNELVKHQQQVHSNEPLAIVNYDDRKKCGICLKTTNELIEHFQTEHKMLLQKEFFNPMQLSDVKLNDLLKIDIHKKIQCGHCDAVFETEDELHIHHSIGHENKEKISIQIIEKQNAFMICGYCQNKVNYDEYFTHFEQHPYVFKCWKCTYQSKDLVELVFHDKRIHERDTLDYHCSMFPDWIKAHFINTKVVFANGLVLCKYNLIGTVLDDSKDFEMLIAGWLEVIKSRFSLLIKPKNHFDEFEIDGKDEINQSALVTIEEKNFLQAELVKQNELANNLVILKLPRIPDMDIRDAFLKLCDKLKVRVSIDDIQQIHRRPREGREGRDDTLVSLKRHELKEEIRYAAQKQIIFSGDIFNLKPDQWSKQIRVISHTTRYYSEMLSIAKEARTERKICHYELTAQGVHIKRTQTSEDRFFISKTELLNYVN